MCLHNVHTRYSYTCSCIVVSEKESMTSRKLSYVIINPRRNRRSSVQTVIHFIIIIHLTHTEEEEANPMTDITKSAKEERNVVVKMNNDDVRVVHVRDEIIADMNYGPSEIIIQALNLAIHFGILIWDEFKVKYNSEIKSIQDVITACCDYWNLSSSRSVCLRGTDGVVVNVLPAGGILTRVKFMIA